VVIANVSAPDEISFTITTGLPATMLVHVQIRFNAFIAYYQSVCSKDKLYMRQSDIKCGEFRARSN
jgi:hypothetical protein